MIRRSTTLVIALAAGLIGPGAPGAQPIALFSQSVHLDPKDPERRQFGRLAFRGGLALRSNDRRFGGFSGLHVSADGRTLMAVSDRGNWLRMTLRHDGDGRLHSITSADMGPLIGVDGRRLAGKAGDAEALDVLPDGSLMVAFERRHRILIYPPSDPPFARRPRTYPIPAGVRDGPANGGLETLIHVGRGYMLSLSERQRAGVGLSRGWVGVDGGWYPLTYARTGGFRPTDAALLPNGDILVLERRFRLGKGSAARLMRVRRRDVAPGRALRGREILRLATPLTVDNFEGLAVRLATVGKNKRETLIYLISDNNFSPLQRTLLLIFALPGE